MRDQADLWAGMFEKSKINRLLMGLDAPRDCVIRFYIYPSDQIALYDTSVDGFLIRML